MAKDFGKPPDELMGMNLNAAESFHFNADVWAALQIFERRVKGSGGETTATSSALGATEQQQMANEQNQRAAKRNSGELAPDPADQLDKLDQLKAQRAAEGGGF